MTAQELIDELSSYPPDEKVVFIDQPHRGSPAVLDIGMVETTEAVMGDNPTIEEMEENREEVICLISGGQVAMSAEDSWPGR